MPWATAGALVAGAWFTYGLALDVSNRVRGDAVQYVRIAFSFQSLGEAIHYAGPRTLGFPLFLYVMRRIVGVEPPVSPATAELFLATISIVLLVVHLAACTGFFLAVRAVVARELGVVLHPVALTLVLAHPGLATHASVPLTDTLGADLLLLGVAPYFHADAVSAARTRHAWAAAAGLALGALVLVRPAALVVVAAFIAAAVLQALALARARRPIVASMTAAAAALVLWQVHTCGARFERVCLMDPAAVETALGESIGWGTTSARHYWSSYSTESDARVVVSDPFLATHLAARCPAHTLGGRDGLLACLASNPVVAPVFLAKKAIGLFDSYQLQPYAVDVTPRWVRLASRPFGALAFAGLVCALGWLVRLASHAAPPSSGDLTVLILLVPVVYIGWQSLFHVEARYGFPAVPFVLTVLVLTLQRAHAAPAPVPRMIAIGVLFAALVFCYQTQRWDLDDPVLPRIEGW